MKKTLKVEITGNWRDDEQEAFNKRVRERVKEAREAMHISQRDLAKKLKYSNSYFSQLENGKIELKAVDLAGIAKLLDKPIAYFIEDDETTREEEQAIHHLRKIRDKEIKKVAIKQLADLANLKQ